MCVFSLPRHSHSTLSTRQPPSLHAQMLRLWCEPGVFQHVSLPATGWCIHISVQVHQASPQRILSSQPSWCMAAPGLLTQTPVGRCPCFLFLGLTTDLSWSPAVPLSEHWPGPGRVRVGVSRPRGLSLSYFLLLPKWPPPGCPALTPVDGVSEPFPTPSGSGYQRGNHSPYASELLGWSLPSAWVGVIPTWTSMTGLFAKRWWGCASHISSQLRERPLWSLSSSTLGGVGGHERRGGLGVYHQEPVLSARSHAGRARGLSPGAVTQLSQQVGCRSPGQLHTDPDPGFRRRPPGSALGSRGDRLCWPCTSHSPGVCSTPGTRHPLPVGPSHTRKPREGLVLAVAPKARRAGPGPGVAWQGSSRAPSQSSIDLVWCAASASFCEQCCR